MKSSIFLLILFIIAAVFYLFWRSKKKSQDNRFIMIIVLCVGIFIIGGGISHFFGSSVTVVNGVTKDDVVKKDYLFFYDAEPRYGDNQTIHITHDRHVIVNKTNRVLSFEPIIYGHGSTDYSSIDISPYSVVKVPDEPFYFFESPSQFIRTKSHPKRIIKGLIKVKKNK